ncbi:MAG: choice-of-anchor Q domain-containing protein [Cyanobacteriota bacterium]
MISLKPKSKQPVFSNRNFRISGLGEKWWRVLMIAGSPFLGLFLWLGSVEAATILVNSADSGSHNEVCTLQDAIEAANNNTEFGGCTKGDPGLDTILFDSSLIGQTITLEASLPTITEDVNFQVENAVQNSRVAILRDKNQEDFVLFSIESNRTVSFENIFLQFGSAPLGQSGGAIQTGTGSTILIKDSNLRGNKGDSGGAIQADQVTITNSTLDDNIARSNGGAIFAKQVIVNNLSDFSNNFAGELGGAISAGEVIISNSVLQDNVANQAGGAIAAGIVNITNNSTLIRNQSEGNGGAIVAEEGTITISDSQIENNSASTSGGGISGNIVNVSNSRIFLNKANNGGGIQAIDVKLENGSRLFNNQAKSSGGILAQNVFVRNSTVEGNIAESGNAGGISAEVVEIDQSLINNNKAANFGGGLFALKATVLDSEITNNTTGNNGGGLDAKQVNVSGSTFSGNRAGVGGAIAASSELKLVNSTLSNNLEGGGVLAQGVVQIINSTIAENIGDGLFLSNSASSATIHNSIFFNNSDGDIIDFSGSDIVTGSRNLIGNPNSTGGLNPTDNLLGINPQLAALTNNGGPTQTRALLENSPAINAGSNALATDAGLNFDQRGSGFPRIVNDTVDIGAFESNFGQPDPIPTPEPEPEDPELPNEPDIPEPEDPIPTPEPEPEDPELPNEPDIPEPEDPELPDEPDISPTPTPIVLPTPPAAPELDPIPNPPRLVGITWEVPRLLLRSNTNFNRQNGIPTIDVRATDLSGVVFEFRNSSDVAGAPFQACIVLPDRLSLTPNGISLEESTKLIINGVERRDFNITLIPPGGSTPPSCNGQSNTGALVLTVPAGIPANGSGSLTFEAVVE